MAAMQTGATQRLASTPSVSLTSLTATLLSSYFLTFRFLRQRSLRRSWNWKKKTEPLRNLPTWTKNLKKHCSKNFAWQWQQTLLKTFRSFPYRTVKMVSKKLNSTTVSQRKRSYYSDNQAQVYYHNSELVRDRMTVRCPNRARTVLTDDTQKTILKKKKNLCNVFLCQSNL